LQPLSRDLNSAKFKKNQRKSKMRGSRRPGARRKPGQLNKRTIEAVKAMGPVGERAIGVLVSAMEDARVPWSCHIQAASLICERAPQSLSLEVGTSILQTQVIDEWPVGYTKEAFDALMQKDITLTVEDLDKCEIAHLDDKGFRYYIPALMCSVLGANRTTTANMLSLRCEILKRP
jgi:hypothetical protein